jgi:hypothetical protein
MAKKRTIDTAENMSEELNAIFNDLVNGTEAISTTKQKLNACDRRLRIVGAQLRYQIARNEKPEIPFLDQK